MKPVSDHPYLEHEVAPGRSGIVQFSIIEICRICRLPPIFSNSLSRVFHQQKSVGLTM